MLDSKTLLLFPFLERFCAPDSSRKKQGISSEDRGVSGALEEDYFSSAVPALSPHTFSVLRASSDRLVGAGEPNPVQQQSERHQFS